MVRGYLIFSGMGLGLCFAGVWKDQSAFGDGRGDAGGKNFVCGGVRAAGPANLVAIFVFDHKAVVLGVVLVIGGHGAQVWGEI